MRLRDRIVIRAVISVVTAFIRPYDAIIYRLIHSFRMGDRPEVYNVSVDERQIAPVQGAKWRFAPIPADIPTTGIGCQ
jgi:hypothetical protein